MKRFAAFMDSLPVFWKSVIITIATLLFSHVVVYDLMSVSFFSPMEKAADFQFSDFYTIVADDRAVSIHDEDIVIVPLDGYTRKEMAKVIDDINFCGPAAVGLDIAFAPPSNPEDDPLAEAMASCTNLVMPVRISADSAAYHMEHLSYYDSFVEPQGGFAAVNIQGDAGQRRTVREFSGFFDTAEGVIPSLPAALVKIVRPEAYKELKDRQQDEESINFASRQFDIIEPEEIIDNPELIEGKIVLLGKMMNAGDLHVTPLDNFMPGLLIHAYTAATILSGDYTRELTPFESYAIAAIACFLLVWFNMWLIDTPTGPVLVRVLQVLMLYFMIVGGTLAFVKYNIDLNFSFAILSTSLGVAAGDIYIGLFRENGVFDWLGNLFSKKNR